MFSMPISPDQIPDLIKTKWGNISFSAEPENVTFYIKFKNNDPSNLHLFSEVDMGIALMDIDETSVSKVKTVIESCLKIGVEQTKTGTAVQYMILENLREEGISVFSKLDFPSINNIARL